LALAQSIALRKLPGPLSLVLVTTVQGVGVGVAVGVGVGKPARAATAMRVKTKASATVRARAPNICTSWRSLFEARGLVQNEGLRITGDRAKRPSSPERFRG